MNTRSSLRSLLLAPLPLPVTWCAIPLRAILGVGCWIHGYAKLTRGPAHFIDVLHALHLPFADALGWATVLTELSAGVLILCGALIPAASLAMILVLLTALVSVHLPYGFSAIRLLSYDTTGAHFGPVGYEVDLLYVAGLVALSIGGPGPLSVDGWLRQHCFNAQPHR
ncbi:MAG TPA: DoxX family protein [Polyangiaceae bacterium]|jgi:putative oxidoreductase|nr:DoxX family protein [Polyangiaceae bacterium]